MKKVKERSEKLKDRTNKNGENAVKNNKRNIVILVLCAIITLSAIIVLWCMIEQKNDEKAVELSTQAGVQGPSVSKAFVSLLVADMKHNGIPADDNIVGYAVESASLYLQTEYYCDYIYNVPLDEEQQNSIDEAINRLIEKHGSKENLEKHLSQYGTNTESVRRYFELSLKQSNVLSYLDRSVTFDQVKDYFYDNYMAVEVVIIFDDEERPNLAEDVYSQIVGGKLTLDEARELYSSGEYKESKATFFVTKTNSEEINAELFEIICGMKEEEISIADFGVAKYIIKKNAADSVDFTVNEEFYNTIRNNVKEQLYKNICDTLSDYIFVNDGVVKKINPSKISPLNISSLTNV